MTALDMQAIAAVFACSILTLSVYAQPSQAPKNPYEGVPGAPPPQDNSVLTNSGIRQISETVFAIGEVQLDRTTKSVSFPAEINMSEGPVEYFCVHQSGKVHESVLRTSVSPFHIHLATLLVSDPGAIPSPAKRGEFEIQNGSPVSLSLLWEKDGKRRTNYAEDFVLKLTTGKAMEKGGFQYTSSQQIGDAFVAHHEGNVIAIMADPAALINIRDPDRANDEIWAVNTNTVPKVATPVQVVLTVRKDSEPKD